MMTDLVGERFACEEFIDVFQSSGCDVVKGFTCEESLVRRYDHIVEAQQPGHREKCSEVPDFHFVLHLSGLSIQPIDTNRWTR